MTFARLLAVVVAVVSLELPVAAGEWAQWRGPSFNGSSEEVGLPVKWSTTVGENGVAWAAGLPGPAEATPVVAAGRVYVSSTANDQNDLVAMCFDAATGKELWKQRLAAGNRARRGTMASPSPVADGKNSFFLFGTGQLFALDADGKTVWSRDLTADAGKFNIMWNYRSSPLLHEGKLYVQVVQGGPSFLMALDAATGKVLWKQARATDAQGEPQQAYTTPVPFKDGKNAGILVAGADALTLHDAGSGKEIWRFTERTGRLVSAPTPMGELICVGRSNGRPLFAVRAGKEKPEEAWARAEAKPDVATPAFYKGLLYVIDDKVGALVCMEPETGAVIWKEKLPSGSNWASPTAADDKVYCLNIKGDVTIFKAGRTAEKLGSVAMGEGDCLSTIAVADGRLFIRTAKHLYAVGRGK